MEKNKLTILFEYGKKMYPNILDISDGEKTFNDGLRIPKVWSVYEEIINNNQNQNVWKLLVAWFMYVSIHKVAKQKFDEGLLYFGINEIDFNYFEENLNSHLNEKEYKKLKNIYNSKKINDLEFIEIINK